MGKVKIKRKSTLIDMTAMSDVTVLLLTFFMLTSTFLQKEPVTVLTPSSVSETKVPVANLAQVLVSPEGKVFLSITGESDPELADVWGSEAIRKEVLKNAVAEYNKTHNPDIELTENDLNVFSKIGTFGVPMKDMKKFLAMSQTEQDKYISDMSNPGVGIPIDDNKDLQRPNEFQLWMRAIYSAGNENLQKQMKKGEGIAVKADKDTPYSTVHHVLDNLQTLKMNRFSLMTALKTEQD